MVFDTLAHEMAHQYQWDIDGVKRIKRGWEPLMSHGPSFFKHRKSINKYGLVLKDSTQSTVDGLTSMS